MIKHRRKQIWISEAFHKKLKREAVDNNMSVLEYTCKLAEDYDIGGDEREKRRSKLNFRF